MSINPLSGVYSGSASQVQRNQTRIQNTIASLVSGSAFSSASSDVAGLSLATQLQSGLSALRQTSGNISRASSTLQVASDAIDRQLAIADRLKSLATQANNGAISDDIREGLNAEARSLVAELDRIAERTNFGNQKLLDGTYTVDIDQTFGENASADEGNTLTIPNTSASALLDGGLDISTQAGAGDALGAIDAARAALLAARSDVGGFSQSLDYAGASLASALFNQEAARSEIGDADFASTATLLNLLNTQQNAALALKAQTNKLPNGVLELLNNDS